MPTPADQQRRSLFPGIMLALAVFAQACAEKELPAAVPQTVQTVQEKTEADRYAYRETGSASWYGREYHGLVTASGEVFDMDGMTAAHRVLPLGSLIRVTNLDTLRSITVKVNDRGPLSGNSIVTLSFGAARELGFAAKGTAPVSIEMKEPPGRTGIFTVQAALFTEEENALWLKDRLSRKYNVVLIEPYQTNLGTFYRVRVGDYGSEDKAELIAGKLKLEGLEPCVLRKD